MLKYQRGGKKRDREIEEESRSGNGADLEQIGLDPNPFNKIQNPIQTRSVTRKVLNNQTHTLIHRINEYPNPPRNPKVF